jgi:hypothetical protein
MENNQMLIRYALGGLLIALLALQGCGKSDVPQKTTNATVGQIPRFATGGTEAAPAVALSPSELQGSWNAGGGKAAVDLLTDGSLKFTNESNLVAIGKISGTALEAPDWGVTGRLSDDKKKLIWSNGVSWTR